MVYCLQLLFMLLLYSIFNKLCEMMFSLLIDINHVNRVNKYLY